MSSSTNDTSTQWYCPHCEAKQLGPATTCWLCEKPLAGESAAADGLRMPTPAEVRSPQIQPERFHFSLATMLLIMTLASVCMGLIVALPGLGIVACILMGPVFIRTIKVVRHRESLGQEVPPGEKVAMFLGSFAVASVIAVIACICAFCSFCGVCASIFALGGGPGQDAWLFAVIMIPVGILSFWGVIRLIVWNRRRYRREIGKE
ncbi:MAG: hypothetical protein ACR2NM_15670 [Bythopirellula sp.]